MNNTYFGVKKFVREFTEDGHKYTLTAKAELYALGKQAPYFAVTGELMRQTNGHGRPDWDSGGCLHDDIEKHIPQLRKYIKWHLVSTEEPMHYIANSLYWAGLQGWTDKKHNSPPNLEYLKSTAKWGAVEGDDKINISLFIGRGNKNSLVNRVKRFFLTRILEKRMRNLQAAFYRDMIDLFGADAVEQAKAFTF